MLKIKFRYKDTLSNGEWRTQKCICSSVEDCKSFYGLDTDPSVEAYEILEVTEDTEDKKYGQD